MHPKYAGSIDVLSQDIASVAHLRSWACVALLTGMAQPRLRKQHIALLPTGVSGEIVVA